ncbi:hypothetical protein [Streptomyces sp. NPDC000410]|uniref:wHTH domain-containing protein n=1 Tax=Streptomyces sp. NPDC000410 TaxID=3154254 RepID=UPI00332F2DF5
MGAHRALLLFVPVYDSPHWPDLSYLRDEYEDLRAGLLEQDYEIDERSGCAGLVSQEVLLRMAAFILEARRGDHLLIYLSGHGFHHDGRHWFAGQDSQVGRPGQPLLSSNVDLERDWHDHAKGSDAERVLVVVDACRDTLEVDGFEGFAGKIDRAVKAPAGTDKLGYLMACAPEEPAAVAGPAEGSFSLFTKAFREILADAQGALRADRLRGLLEKSMEDLRKRQQVVPRKQIPRLCVEQGGPLFVVVPTSPPSASRHLLIRDPRLWDRVTDRTEGEDLLAEAALVIDSTLDPWLREARTRLAQDPWLDWEADLRASDSLAQLIEHLPSEVTFTPAEAALLALAPALYHGFRVRLASRTDPESRVEWEQYPRLRRQTADETGPHGRSRDRDVAESWVFHQTRWSPGNAHNFTYDLVDYLDMMLAGTGALADVCTPPVMSWLFRAMRHGGGVLAEPPALPYAPGPDVGHQKVGLLLCVAQTMSLDRSELPAVLVEHMGGRDRIGMRHVRQVIREAEWTPSGQDRGRGTLGLSAECGYQALMVALQERVKELDGLLCSELNLPVLPLLPSRASGVEVKPEKKADGRTDKFFPVATRFGLDGSRVRELLVGEQLYADKYLAVRELYQNAMDACQVRQARELARQPIGRRRRGADGVRGEDGEGQESPERGTSWVGRITITQGVDGGREFVECLDNGSGMGRGELLYSFAQGGVRLSHLSSFQEEKLDWERLGIPFQENSRFGIGVLSYFMLADELVVVTRKFPREGPPDSAALRVTIDGPDHLFQVTEDTEDEHFSDGRCGTKVRLYLRAGLDGFSCVKALRSVLGVARFHTVARYGDEDPETWEPDDYQSRPDTGTAPAIGASGMVVPVTGGEVFWCERGGALLVDGIAVDSRLSPDPAGGRAERAAPQPSVRGAVVNLRGRVVTRPGKKKAVPQLTVDRRRITDDVTDTVFSLLGKRESVRALVDSKLLTVSWLAGIAKEEPRLADAIVTGLVRRGGKLTYDEGGDGTADLARTGFMVADRELRAVWNAPLPPQLRREGPNFPRERAARLPAHLALWRYAAHFPDDVRVALGEVCPPELGDVPLRPALPSDDLILGRQEGSQGNVTASWDAQPPPGELFARAEELGEPYATVVDRLAALGLSAPRTERTTALTAHEVSRLTSQDADGVPPYLYPGDAIRVWQVLATCGDDAHAAADAEAFLYELGYDTKAFSALLDAASPESGLVRSLKAEGGELMSRGARLAFDSPERLLAAADACGMSVKEIRGVLASQTFAVPRPRDLVRMYVGWPDDSPSPWDRESEPPVALLPDLYRLAHLRECTTAEAARLLEAFGYRVDEPGDDRPAPEEAELLVLPVADGRFLNPRTAVTLLDLRVLAQHKGLPLSGVADSLRALSVEVPEGLPDSLDERDLPLLTQADEEPNALPRGLDLSLPVPVAHLTLLAARLGRTVEEIRTRLNELGMTVAPLPDPETELFDPRTEQWIAVGWIPYSAEPERHEVPFAHVLCTAADQGWDLDTTAEVMRARGLVVPAGEDGRTPEADGRDLTLLSRRCDGQAPWLALTEEVSPDHVLRAAKETGMPVADVRARLTALGHDVFTIEEDGDADYFVSLLRDMPGTPHHPVDLWPYNDIKDSRVPAACVWMLSRMSRRTLDGIAALLRAAGAELAEREYPPGPPDERELLLLRENAAPDGPWLVCGETVGLEHLLVSAHRLGMTVTEVAARLRDDFGLDVPDVGELVARTWAEVPRSAPWGAAGSG